MLTTSIAARASVMLMAVFVLAMGRAIAAYPGGSWADAGAEGFTFWVNYWCDLLRSVGMDGRPNAAAAFLARLAFFALAASLVGFWVAVGPLFASTRSARVVLVVGSLASLTTVSMALAPYDSYRVLHSVLSLLAGGLGFAAAAPVIVTTARSFPRAWACRAAGVAFVLTGGANGVVYAMLVVQGGGDSVALPVIQKLATLGLLAWMATTLMLVSDARTRAATRGP